MRRLISSGGTIFLIFGGFWAGPLTGVARLLVKHVNVFHHSSANTSHPPAPPKPTRPNTFRWLNSQHYGLNLPSERVD
jgi:hypothetical protein